MATNAAPATGSVIGKTGEWPGPGIRREDPAEIEMADKELAGDSQRDGDGSDQQRVCPP